MNSSNAAEYQTPCKEANPPPKQDICDSSPISIMSESSRRDLDDEFAATSPRRPHLYTGASGWGSDSDTDGDDDLL